jgi:hypothetical protein
MPRQSRPTTVKPGKRLTVHRSADRSPVEAIADLPEKDRRDLTGRAVAIIRLLETSEVPDDLEVRTTF